MKCFILVLSVLSLGAAEVKKDAVDESISAFVRGSKKSGSLSKAVGIDEEWVKQAGEDIKAELKGKLKEAFNEVFQKVKDNTDHGKQVAEELLEKAEEVRSEGVESSDNEKTLIKNLKRKAKEALQNILAKLSLGKRSFDDQIDGIARSKFGDILELVIEKVTSDEAVQKIRKYVKNIASNNELVLELKAFGEKLSNTDIKEIICGLLSHNYRISRAATTKSETWKKIKSSFKDFEIKLGEYSKKFDEWIKSTWIQGIVKVQKKYGNVKGQAMQHISHEKEFSTNAAKKALDIFQLHKENLGKIWEQLTETVKQSIGIF